MKPVTKHILTILRAALLLTAAGVSVPSHAAATKPNILVILADDK